MGGLKIGLKEHTHFYSFIHLFNIPTVIQIMYIISQDGVHCTHTLCQGENLLNMKERKPQQELFSC